MNRGRRGEHGNTPSSRLLLRGMTGALARRRRALLFAQGSAFASRPPLLLFVEVVGKSRRGMRRRRCS